MTNDDIEILYSQIDDLLKIYNENDPLNKENYDFQKLNDTYIKMMQYILSEEDCKSLLSWMDANDFWKSPASTMFHGNFETGLAIHTMQVIVQSLKFAKTVLADFFTSPMAPNFSFTAQDIFISALAHDFCKAGSYKIQYRNTKDLYGNWKKEPYYKTRSELRNLGHGNESAFILISLIPSIIERRNVIEAVSRHMGFSDLSDLERMNYSNFLQNPLVLLLQLADQTAAAWYDN